MKMFSSKQQVYYPISCEITNSRQLFKSKNSLLQHNNVSYMLLLPKIFTEWGVGAEPPQVAAKGAEPPSSTILAELCAVAKVYRFNFSHMRTGGS